MASEPPDILYPLYETTFNLFRVSPLHTGLEASLDYATLREQAQRLRDILAGEVLRGVRVGLDTEDTTLAHTGALETVTWIHLPHEERWDGQVGGTRIAEDDESTLMLNDNRGMLVTITYEKQEYTAIMLRDVRARDWDETSIRMGPGRNGFEHFPLMLLKMPLSLRNVFTEFLATTFDARVSLLQFPSSYVTTVFEDYLAYVCVDEDGEPLDAAECNRSMKKIMGGVEVHIGFDLPGGSSALKTIDIKLSKDDLPRIIARGKLHGKGGQETPLWTALTGYVNAHLALDLNHDRVKVLRIACDAFVFGAEGKVKCIYPGIDEDGAQRRATKRLVNELITAAKGGSLSEALKEARD